MESIIKKFAMEVEKEIKNTIKSLANHYNIDEKEAYNYIMGEKENNNAKRGRPKKMEEETKEKGPRGRPPKEEKKITRLVGEDLITRLLEQAKKNEMK